jgi:hypothetical protein
MNSKDYHMTSSSDSHPRLSQLKPRMISRIILENDLVEKSTFQERRPLSMKSTSSSSSGSAASQVSLDQMFPDNGKYHLAEKFFHNPLVGSQSVPNSSTETQTIQTSSRLTRFARKSIKMALKRISPRTKKQIVKENKSKTKQQTRSQQSVFVTTQDDGATSQLVNKKTYRKKASDEALYVYHVADTTLHQLNSRNVRS